jgi:transposase
VNFVWNYCNQASYEHWVRQRHWLTYCELHTLTKGASAKLPINSQTIQRIAQEHTTRREQFRRIKLRWRSARQSLGWIPFSGQTFLCDGDKVRYNGQLFRLWLSRPLPMGAKIKAGSFTQDAKGRWYVHLNIEADIHKEHGDRDIGIDLGLKEQAVCSDGVSYSRENLTVRYEHKLASAQRAHKKRLVRTLHAKIKNKRLDWAHKTTTALCQSSERIAWGGVKSKGLMKTNLAKSVADAAWYQFKTMLRYKANTHNTAKSEVNEAYSTQTCSHCFERTGPRGRQQLGVREWQCTHCQAIHHRDINAARNIWHIAWVGPLVEASSGQCLSLVTRATGKHVRNKGHSKASDQGIDR